ncbi:hypothetical protein D3C87_1867640 [compost metagenome]
MAEQAGEKFPLDGDVVTPISIMMTPGWSKVAGPLELRNDYSDLDLYTQWEKENLLGIFDYVFDLSPEALKEMATP